MLVCGRRKERSQPERTERTRARWQTRCSTKRANQRAEETTTGTGEGKRGGFPADLGGGWSRTRGRGRVGAARPGGGASGRRGCPGTACRSSRSSTSPRASCWVLAALVSLRISTRFFTKKLRISFANPKPSQNQEIYYFVIITDGFKKFSIKLTNHRHRLINYRHRHTKYRDDIIGMA
jgi:hypothetical protein